jgi:hypothetical protein
MTFECFSAGDGFRDRDRRYFARGMASECFCGCGRKLRWTHPGRVLASNTAGNVDAHADELARSSAAMPHFAALAPVEAHGRELAKAWVEVAHGERRRSEGLNQATDAFLDLVQKVTHTPDELPPPDWQPPWMP